MFNLILFAQQTSWVDFISLKSDITLAPEKELVDGFLTIEFRILKPIDSVFIDAKNMSFKNVLLNNDSLNYTNDGLKLWLKHSFKTDSIYKVSFNYSAKPKKAMYFVDWGLVDGNKQVWTQGQGKYTSHWLPSIDDMNDKIIFNIAVTFDSDYIVIANGNLLNKQQKQDTTTWTYAMNKPMSSYLVALAIGKYYKKIVFSKSGIPLEMYYYPNDSLKFEPTYRYTKELFDFLESEIGVSYPWQNYKQIPVKDFLYAGMENTSTTLFSDSFVVDSVAFNDKNYVNVNAHEMAHQWFGNLVTETSGTHHWLQEGFATFYALLAEKQIFGKHYYDWQMYLYAQELLEQEKKGESTALLNPHSSSATFYKKGALALHVLKQIIGDKAFKKAVKNYLIAYQFKNVETNFFIQEAEKASGKDLSSFVKNWLNASSFNYQKCIEILKKDSQIISQLEALENELLVSKHSLDYKLNNYYNNATHPEIKELLFSKHLNSLLTDYNIYLKGLHAKDLKVRQAVAINLRTIPIELKKPYEMLLNDNSYVTREKALFNLWVNFPENRIDYLLKTKHLYGFNDYNIRIVWLTLALLTNGFEIDKKQTYYDELVNYTLPKFNYELRQNAFMYLNEIKGCNALCIENLQQATAHPSWQFSKFAKNLLLELETKNK